MDFEITEKQKKIFEEAVAFGREKIEPVIAEYDERCEYPVDLFREMGKRGWLGFNIPEKYGGAERDTISYTMLVMAISKYSASLGLAIDTHYLLSEAIKLYGNDEMKENYLPKLAKTEIIGGFAITEPTAGSDAAGIEGTAVKEGDEYVLNGEKSIIVGGAVADAVIAFFKTAPEAGAKGITAFLVDTKTPGIKKEPLNPVGLRACGLAKYKFENVRVPKENVIGQEGQGLRIALSVLDFGRIGVASVATGIAEAALERAIEYAKKRTQFGQPIMKFQGLRWMLADIKLGVEAAKLLTWKAAYLRDKGVRYTVEAAMAKLFATELAMKATIKAIQVHGHYGFLKDLPLERYMRDAKGLEIAEGTSEIQRFIIARALFGG